MRHWERISESVKRFEIKFSFHVRRILKNTLWELLEVNGIKWGSLQEMKDSISERNLVVYMVLSILMRNFY